VNEGEKKSGFYLLSDNMDAFTARVALANNAQHSLDIQYYMMHNDASGRYLAYALLQAADRGIKVRILVDDINLAGRDSRLKMLAQHDDIEIRIFNPLTNRDWFRNLELIINLDRAGRRMHNKLFIADQRYAIIGGRNIGDEYFDARRSLNFVDLDLLITGPIIAELRQSFEEYWRSVWATPVEQLSKIRVMKSHLSHIRARLRDYWRRFRNTGYFRQSESSALSRRIAEDDIDFTWAEASLLYDKPEKLTTRYSNHMVHFGPRTMPMFNAAEQELLIASPYFIPGDAGCMWMIDKQKSGVDLKVLTNSLAATDVPVVHAGYSQYRERLVANGISLFELKRDAITRKLHSRLLLPYRSHASLHAKYIVIDRRRVLIGSANIDPRSSNLNTEIGIAIDSDELAEKVSALFEQTSEPDKSYQLKIEENRLVWHTLKQGIKLQYRHDPDSSLLKRLYVYLVGLLPIESLL